MLPEVADEASESPMNYLRSPTRYQMGHEIARKKVAVK
jgi:hypothetical protein